MRKLIHWIKKKLALRTLYLDYIRSTSSIETLIKYHHEQKVYCSLYGPNHPACTLYTFKLRHAFNKAKLQLVKILDACVYITERYTFSTNERQTVQQVGRFATELMRSISQYEDTIDDMEDL